MSYGLVFNSTVVLVFQCHVGTTSPGGICSNLSDENVARKTNRVSVTAERQFETEIPLYCPVPTHAKTLPLLDSGPKSHRH